MSAEQCREHCVDWPNSYVLYPTDFLPPYLYLSRFTACPGYPISQLRAARVASDQYLSVSDHVTSGSNLLADDQCLSVCRPAVTCWLMTSICPCDVRQ